MAEGSGNFDFTVSVGVTGDWAPFRAEAQRQLESFQKQGVTIPVGSGGPAGVTMHMPPQTAAQLLSNYGGGAAVAGPIPDQAVQLTMARAAAVRPVSAELAAARALSGGVASAMTAAAVAAGGGAGGAAGAGWPGGWPALAAAVAAAGAAGAAGAGWPGGAPPPAGLPIPTPVPTPSPTPPPPPIPVPVPPLPGRRGTAAFGGLNRFTSFAYGAYALGRLAHATLEHDRDIRQAEGDPYGIVRADIAYQEHAARAFPVVGDIALFAREAVTGDIEYIESTLRAAERRNRVTGMQRERVLTQRELRAGRGFEGKIEETRIGYTRTMAELRERQAKISSEIRQTPEATLTLRGWVPAPGLPEKMAEVTELGRQMGLAGDEQKAAERRIRQDQYLARIEMSGRAADTADEAKVARGQISSLTAQRQSLLRQQAGEALEFAIRNPSLLPEVGQLHIAQRQALVAEQEQHEQLRDIESTGTVRALDIAAQNRPFESRLEAARARGAAAMFEARGNHAEYVRRQSESLAERRAIIAEESKRREIEGIRTVGATASLALENARMPYEADLTGIAADREAALAGVPADNPAQRWRIQALYAQQAIGYARRYQDRMTLVSMGLNAQERVTGILADNRRPAGERQIAAMAASIVGDANERAQAFLQEGQPAFADQALRIGRNQLRAAGLEFRSRLRLEEIEGINRVDLRAGSNIQRQLGEFRQAEKELGEGVGVGTGGDVAAWRDSVLHALETIADSLRGGVGVGP